MSDLLFLMLIFNSVKGYFIGQQIQEYSAAVFCRSNNLTFYNHTPFSYLIDEPNLCFDEVFLLTYIQSSSDHFQKRNIIRQTFGSLRFVSNQPVRLLFIVGRPSNGHNQKQIEDESKSYRDIVQADFVDTYHNLTLKHIVALDWIDRFCSQAQFISKTDDDTFVSIFQLVTYLMDKFHSGDPFILGQISYNEAPIRDKRIKWRVSKEMYEEDKYPPFMKGFAYVMSRSTIKSLLICSYYRKYLYIDDIFMTGLVASMANVKLVDFERFYGHQWFWNENITMEMMDNLFFVNQMEYHPNRWHELWKCALRTES